MVNESGEGEEWELGNDEEEGLELGSSEKILTTVGRWSGRSLWGSVG